MDDPRPLLHRAGELAARLIGNVKPDQFDAPTPCTEWTVRQLINHMAYGNLHFAAIVSGGAGPDPGADVIGDADPATVFRETFTKLADEVADDAVLERTFPTPVGEGPGSQLVGVRTIELTVHTWDLAAATGQPRDLDPQLVAFADEAMRARAIPRGGDSPFEGERPAPEGAGQADRLAAYLGRTVPSPA